MRRSWRNKFDLERAFVVRRPLTVGGVKLAPGDPFDKALVNVRRLRQLYDQRVIMFAGDEPGAIVRSDKDDYRRRKHEARAADQEAMVFDPERPFTEEELQAEREAWDRLYPNVAPDDPRDAVDIPKAWAKLAWPKRVALAANFSAEPLETKEAVASAIKAELARRGTS